MAKASFRSCDHLLIRMAPGQNATPGDLLEQYKLAVSSWNQEMQRFWFRYNILVGLELAALIGLAAKYNEIKEHPVIFGMFLAVMVLYSLFTLAILYHGIEVYKKIEYVLTTIEKRSDARLFLMRIFLAQPFPMKDPKGMLYGVRIQQVLAGAWLVIACCEIYKIIREVC